MKIKTMSKENIKKSTTALKGFGKSCKQHFRMKSTGKPFVQEFNALRFSKMMSKGILTVIILALFASGANAQDNSRSGFIFGAAMGGGTLIQKDEGLSSKSYGRYSLLNLKVGYMLNPETAICLHVPSGGHKENGETRAFEATLLGVQHWFTPKFWGMAGTGLAMDMPAFYDTEIDDPEFYFGPALSLGAGYEIFKTGSFTFDLQLRYLYGNYDIEGINRQCSAFDLLIGINLY